MHLVPLLAFHVRHPEHNGEWLVCLWPIGSSRSWVVDEAEFLSREGA